MVSLMFMLLLNHSPLFFNLFLAGFGDEVGVGSWIKESSFLLCCYSPSVDILIAIKSFAGSIGVESGRLEFDFSATLVPYGLSLDRNWPVLLTTRGWGDREVQIISDSVVSCRNGKPI